MYKIGQTDGVAKCCSNVGVPVACIKTYLMKMAKSAADLPCACKAKSDMQVLASGEFAASTSSCCAGGTSSKTGSGGGCCCGGCCGKSCCGGKGCPPNLYSGSGANDEKTQNVLEQAAAKEQESFISETPDQQPQAQIADAFKSTLGGTPQQPAPQVVEQPPSSPTPVLATMQDVLNSDVPVINQAKWETAKDFQAQFCVNRPYPECEYCQYATAIMEMSEVDIVDFLHSIRDCLDALNQGEVGWAEQRFVCPGQVAAMLGAEFGPIGELAGRTAAAALIGSMALHGALKSVRSFSRQAAHHDLRHEMVSTLCSAIRSGGGGNHYVELLNDIMCNLGVDAHDQFCAPKWSKGNRQSRTDGVTPGRMNDLCGRTPISEKAGACAKSVGPAMTAISKPKDTVPANPKPPTPTTNTHVVCTDVTVQIDPKTPSVNGVPKPKTYLYKDDTGTFVPVPEQPKIGEPLARFEEKYGPLYTEEDVTGLIDTVAKTPAPALEIANNLVEESIRTGTPLEDLIEEMVETSVTPLAPAKPTVGAPRRTGSPATSITKRDPIPNTVAEENPVISAAPVSTEKRDTPSEAATEAAYESAVISVSGGGGSGSKARFENDLVDGRDAGKDPEVIIQAARAIEALSKINEPVVLPNNVPFEEPVSMNSRDYEENVVYTPNLVTRNQVPASEMVKLSGIGLDLYEISVGYALDQEVNGSTPPRDVKAVRIPTILDKFPEW